MARIKARLITTAATAGTSSNTTQQDADITQLTHSFNVMTVAESAASSDLESSTITLTSSLATSTLATSAISVVSHAHGRQRRQERGIEKRELQEAIKYGRKETANPGRDGKLRWRYTHKGVVYITDETSRHEITSWRLDDAPEPAPAVVEGQEGAGTAHFVMVVDMSGSMRRDDILGYSSRAHAVYECLARDLIEPQLKQGTEGIRVTLIEMYDDATVLRKRSALDEGLLELLHKRGYVYPHSHGNYLPALRAASDILLEEAGLQSQLFLVFLSDGAPSDHADMECDHGICVWQPDGTGMIRPNGKDQLHSCGYTTVQTCRQQLRQRVETECVRIIRNLGDMLGRDRVQIHTVAFGPETENYAVLQNMAAALPRSSFQKLHLSLESLRTAFTSLTSSLTTLRTELGGLATLTLRAGLASQRVERKATGGTSLSKHEWDFYIASACIAKLKWDNQEKTLVPEPFFEQPGVTEKAYVHGVVHNKSWFGRGAERVVYQCREVAGYDPHSKVTRCVGPKLVAKQSVYEEQMFNPSFHRTFLRTQAEAEELAQLFNSALSGSPASWQIRFLPCWVYQVKDERYASGEGEFLVEEELEGEYTKWNNNAGGVARSLHHGLKHDLGASLGAIAEDDEEEEQEEEGNVSPADVPQCFSHFTYVKTHGQKLVCDLQGVWNSTDGFTFTDPVIHHVSGSKLNGATDKGQPGMRAFFRTHVCNDLCRRLRLEGVRAL